MTIPRNSKGKSQNAKLQFKIQKEGMGLDSSFCWNDSPFFCVIIHGMLDVITIGSATMDFFVETELPSIPWDTPFGSAIVMPLGEKFASPHSLVTSGGNAINTAVTFARQELSVATAVKINRDVAGTIIYNRLREEGISDKFIIWDNKCPTSRSVVLLYRGERSIITHQGSGASLALKDFNFNKMKAKWWYVSLAGDSYKLFTSIAKQAKEMNINLALNPSVRHIRAGKKQLISSLKYVDFLVLNEGEAAELAEISFSNENENKIFAKIDKMAPGIVAVTRGSAGSTVSDGTYLYKTGVVKTKKMADRTGAGDAYGAGFVAGLIHSGEACQKPNYNLQNIQYAIRLATANAASVVETIGASENALSKNNFDSSTRFQELKTVISKNE